MEGLQYAGFDDVLPALQHLLKDAASPSEGYILEAAIADIGALRKALEEWIAYADKLEAILELVCGQSKDQLIKLHAEQGLRLVRPSQPPQHP